MPQTRVHERRRHYPLEAMAGATTAALQSINIARAASTTPGRRAPERRIAPARSQRQTSPESTMLVNCVAYQNGKKLADIPVADISDYLVKPDCFVWVALFDPTHEEMDQMAEEFGLHPLAVEDARKGYQRPKIEEYDDSLFA